MAILGMGTALAHERKPEAFKEAADFGGFEDGDGTHVQATATF